MVLRQQNRVADASDDASQQRKGVAVLEPVGKVSSCDAENGRDDEDGDAADLGLRGFVA